MRAAGAGPAAAWDELLAVPTAEMHSCPSAPRAVVRSEIPHPAARRSVGGRWAAAARIESAGGRGRARSGWTAAETAASAALRSCREARSSAGGGHLQVAVVGAVTALRFPGWPDETLTPAAAARSSRPPG